jgi:subtilase family serine protease
MKLRVSRKFRICFTLFTLVGTGALCVACGTSSSATAPASGQHTGAAADNCLTVDACYSAQQIRTAYGVQPLLNRGIDGAGETVSLVEIAPGRLDPPKITDLSQDVNGFDSLSDLAAAKIQIVNTLASSASSESANEEEVEDIEVVHAIAPAATIRVILINPASEKSPQALVGTLSSAFSLGLSGGAVVSISGSFGEHCFTSAEVDRLQSTLLVAMADHVTVVSSSGDFGAVSKPCPGSTAFSPIKEVGLPDADPLVLGVGGTTLSVDRTSGEYIKETAWNSPPNPPLLHSQASGGGFSHLFPRPSYQDGIGGVGSTRGVPDVAADASADTGMALVINDGGQKYYVTPAGGTSAGAPLWAGLMALADQYAGRHLGFVNAAIYDIGKSANYHRAFHDVVKGNNTVIFPSKTVVGYQASQGWDPVTGWGSPNAQVLVPLLAQVP